MAAARPVLDPRWVDDAFSRVEDLVYSGDAASLAATVSSLAVERAALVAEAAGGPVR